MRKVVKVFTGEDSLSGWAGMVRGPPAASCPRSRTWSNHQRIPGCHGRSPLKTSIGIIFLLRYIEMHHHVLNNM